MTQGGPQWDTDYDKGYAAGKLAAAVESHHYPDRWKEQVAVLLHHDPPAPQEPPTIPMNQWMAVDSVDENGPVTLRPNGTLGNAQVRLEEITQCHCGCARSKHVNRAWDCTLCGHCPRYRIRTGPVF